MKQIMKSHTIVKYPKLAAVVGHPISHSLSPTIHQWWAAREGINAHYVPVDAGDTAEDFKAKIQHLKSLGFKGVNVTLPYKELALQISNAASRNAQFIGAANMLSFIDDDIYADNSDVEGFTHATMEAWQVKHGSSIQFLSGIKTALLLGAGGAARGVLASLIQMGLSEITIANRTREKAEAIASQFQGFLNNRIEINIIDWQDRASHPAQFIVNTTSLGMTGQSSLDFSIDPGLGHALIADIVYQPLETPLLTDAKKHNLLNVDGLAMLIYQARRGYQTWLGDEAPVVPELKQTLVQLMDYREQKKKIIPPLKIGLTGSIGMGKSTAAGFFGEQGCKIWNADDAVHRLYAKGGEAVEPVAQLFPTAITDGAVDRQKLSALIMEDVQVLQRLEALIHPLVATDREKFIQAAAAADQDMVVLDIPLLFENQYQGVFDAIVVVSAPPEVQRKRVLSRPGMSEAKFAQILARQMPDIEKRIRADFVLQTDQPMETTQAQVKDIVRDLRMQFLSKFS